MCCALYKALPMENIALSIVLLLLLLFLLMASVTQEKNLHIVHLGEHLDHKTPEEIEDIHHSYLLSVKENEDDAKSSLIYSYKKISGFAALLNPHEAHKLSEMENVTSVFQSHGRKISLQTTRSWEFSGLHEPTQGNADNDNLWLKSRYGENVIIGVIDSGVWPESKSFNDDGMEPIPLTWNGICQSGDAFNSSNCNRKIIGARYYHKGAEAVLGHPVNRTIDFLSPRDAHGHGTHTASTAAGRRVDNASSVGGFALGVATGGAPLGRLAIYKACWLSLDCSEADVLAAFDDAIADGVHIISISMNDYNQLPYASSCITVGAFHAVRNGIAVACSAGNYGPTPSTVRNEAPWTVTVGAASVDRIFAAPVLLGNNITIPGQTLTSYKLKRKLYPLVSADQVINPGVDKNLTRECSDGSLSPKKAKGKIILCFAETGDTWEKGKEVKRAGGYGLIIASNKVEGNTLSITIDDHVLPATAVDYTNGLHIMKYIQSATRAKAYIVPAKTVLGAKPAPIPYVYSSRGPSTISPDILKPDITAPGMHILAAWKEGSPLGLDADVEKYRIITGTSMASPHVAGALALLKAVHPDWSPSALRSALMTSATLINNEGNPITDHTDALATPFVLGSGFFNPTKAVDPGLVYDASHTDYLIFLCSIGEYNLTGSFKCPENPPSPGNLNYPSVAIPELKGTVTVLRTVTNVGCRGALYVSSVQSPQWFTVKITPAVLYFGREREKKNFTVTVKMNSSFVGKIKKGQYGFGRLKWSDGVHDVVSPLAVSVA
ncbi:subtilase family protein [Striga asiatica]|uniref:Subtilase family protein n=1 Tax=Striga asiatica TaxID=4170 RepID=A0A5A7QZQ3_STRAF|nr:subtilase family protein [Striga asiatica]